MKRIKILLITAAATAGMLFAQGPAGQQGQGMQAGQRLRVQGARRAAQANRMQNRRQNRLLVKYLGLTEEQIAKRREINQAAAEQTRPIREQLAQARTELQTAIRGLQPVDATANQIGALTGQLTAIRAKAQQDFLRLLTPEQLQKLEELKAPPPGPPSRK